MRFQMCLFGVIESLEKRTLIDGRTGIADIRYMDPDGTDFFNEVLTVFITATESAGRIGTGFPGTFLPTESGRLDFTGKAVYTRIVWVSRPTGRNLYGILADFS